MRTNVSKNRRLFLFPKRAVPGIFMMSIVLFAVAFLGAGCNESHSIDSAGVVVLLNSDLQESAVTIEKVVPYLGHFGIKHQLVDIAKEVVDSKKIDPALIIIGHNGLTNSDQNNLNSSVERFLAQCQSRGTGILSFDNTMPGSLLSQLEGEVDPGVGELKFNNQDHYITEYREVGEMKSLFGYMSLPKMTVNQGEVLITGNNQPLLVVGTQSKGRVAQWTSQDWMYYSLLGPLGGLDDCLWRSIVWAARKPFVMQALPPIVTMRVDDCVGSGRQQWDVTPFQWVKTANKYGFKPWLGLFPYNVTPEAAKELKELLDAKLATSTPHAFGRPPRPESRKENIRAYYQEQMAETHFLPDYWYPNAIPYLSEFYDEFIYFDHNNQKPWPDDVSKRILAAVDDWYREMEMPMGEYLVPHWGEISSNMLNHIQDEWNIEFVSIREVDKSWGQQTPEYSLAKGEKPVTTAPFRLYDEPVVGMEKDTITSRSSYNVGFREYNGVRFFDFSSSINDITGYEWMPDNDVEATADRGIKTILRGLQAKALAVLFTHETDYVYDVEPENWDAIFRIISKGIAGYDPIFKTTDEALRILRAFHTSDLSDAQYNETKQQLSLKLVGETDVPTSVFVYTDDGESVVEKMVEIPIIKNDLTQLVQLSK